ncbi:MAG: Bug family tripartite tricarboxylate transporter substrate binding protein [Lautropia sp.]
MLDRRRTIASLALFAASLTAAGGALAQSGFPVKSLRIIPMGTGFPENTTRMLAAEIAEMTGQSVVVEAKPGANGILASEYVAKQPADGYTILIGTNSTHAANQSLYKKLPYDFINDFAPISGVSQGLLLAAVNPARMSVRSIAELTTLAKKEPGKLTFGWGGSSPRAAAELYKQIAGVKLVDVPYKTNPQAISDLLGGQIDLIFADLAIISQHLKAGTLRPLAVTGVQRASSFPDVPTMQEAGVPGYDLTFWLAAYVPAGTPKDIVNRLNELFVAALGRPKMVEYLTNVGSVPFPTTPDQLMKFQQDESVKWKRIIEFAGMAPQ